MSHRLWVGYVLIVLSCIAWAILPLLPFLGFDTERLLAWGGVVFLIAELTWWGGVLLLGPEFIGVTKRYWCVVQQYRRCARRRAVQAKSSTGAFKL